MTIILDDKLIDAETWVVEVTCEKVDIHDREGCAHIMRVLSAQDLVLMYWRGPIFPHYYAGVECPRCGKCTKVKTVPFSVMLELDTRENRRSAIFDGYSDAL